MSVNKENPKKPLNFGCIKCDFYTSNKKDYNKHLTTRKHSGVKKNGTIIFFIKSAIGSHIFFPCLKHKNIPEIILPITRAR